MSTEKKAKALNRRLDLLEKELNAIRGQLSILSPILKDSSSLSKKEVKATPEKKKESTFNIEMLLGANLFGKLGLLTVIIGVVLFIKMAIDNRWLNESARIVVILVSGFIVFGYSLYLAKRRYRILPPAMTGAGLAIAYTAIFSAYFFYDLLGNVETFAFLAILSIYFTVLAIAARSQTLYLFGLLGAYMAPILISSGENSYRFLFGYLFFVTIGYLILSRFQWWRISAYLILIANTAVYIGWQDDNLNNSSFTVPFLFLFVVFLIYVFRGLIVIPRSRKTTSMWEHVLLFANIVIFAVLGFYTVYEFYPKATPHFLISTALVLVGLVYIFERFGRSFLDDAQVKIIKGIMLAGTIPIVFAAITDFTEGKTLGMSWIAFAGVLSIFSVLMRNRYYTLVSVLFWACALVRLYFFEHSLEDYTVIINSRFALYVCAAILASLTYYFQRKEPLHKLMFLFAFIAGITIILGSLMENHDFIRDKHYENLGYTFVLIFYSMALLAFGLIRSNKTARLCSIGLASIVILKLYLYDIWTLNEQIRIIAGISIGILLVILSSSLTRTLVS